MSTITSPGFIRAFLLCLFSSIRPHLGGQCHIALMGSLGVPQQGTVLAHLEGERRASSTDGGARKVMYCTIKGPGGRTRPEESFPSPHPCLLPSPSHAAP